MVLVIHFVAKTFAISVLFLESLNSPSSNYKFFKRHIWQYDHGKYNRLRALASTTEWTQVHDDNIDVYALNITNKVMSLAKECIPNKIVTIRPLDAP